MPSLPRNCLDDAVEGIIATNSTDGSDRTILAVRDLHQSQIQKRKNRIEQGMWVSKSQSLLLDVGPSIPHVLNIPWVSCSNSKFQITTLLGHGIGVAMGSWSKPINNHKTSGGEALLVVPHQTFELWCLAIFPR